MRLITKLALFLALGLASAFPAGAQTLDVLANFNADAGAPKAKLLLASDGYLYGTTTAGGQWGRGSVFRIHPNGTGFQVVYSFLDYEGIGPAAELIEYAGSLYGTARGGGDLTTGSGTVFRLELPIGSGFEAVHQFNQSGGASPAAGLLELNGIFYGTTEGGGAYEQGTVFSLDPGTSPATFTLLHSFGQGGAMASPNGALVEVGGMLYGTTTFGGPNNGGTVFRISPSGAQFDTVASEVGNPQGSLLRIGSDLYGTTTGGGQGEGTIFRIDTNIDHLSVIHAFDPNDPNSGSVPRAGLMLAANGRLYGTTESGGVNFQGAVFELDLATGQVATRHSFAAATTGSSPLAGLVEVGGDLYGTASDRGPGSNGTVFRLDLATGATSAIWIFGPTGPVFPSAEVIEVGGSFISTSYGGGTRQYGTVFKWDSATSNLSVLHSFERDVDGAYLTAGVIQGSDGRLDGTTTSGGEPCALRRERALIAAPAACSGSISTAATSRYCMASTADSAAPLIPMHACWRLADNCSGRRPSVGSTRFGTVFRLNLDGTGFQILHDFNETDPLDGSAPVSSLMFGTDGLLYGTTARGGEHERNGVPREPCRGWFRTAAFVRRIESARRRAAGVGAGASRADRIHGHYDRRRTVRAPARSAAALSTSSTCSTSPPAFKVLRAFKDCCVNPYGSYPHGGLVKGAGRWAYGVTSTGGPSGFGTIYAISSNGTIRLLHDFTVSDGGNPWAGLTIGADGSLYGTTQGGGTEWRRRAVPPAVRFGWRQRSRPARQLSDLRQSVANRHRRRWHRRRLSGRHAGHSGGEADARYVAVHLRRHSQSGHRHDDASRCGADRRHCSHLQRLVNAADQRGHVCGRRRHSPSQGYSADTVTALMVISKATPVVTWNNPAHIFNPAPLTAR